MHRATYRGDSKENHAPCTPTFYGKDRKERLEKYVAKNGRRDDAK